MKPIGNFNRLPKTFKQPEKLKPGQSVTYRLDENFKSLVITSREGTKVERWPENIKIPVTDTVFLTYKDDQGEERSDLFDIGLISRVDRDNIPTAIESWWLPANALKGEFTLSAG